LQKFPDNFCKNCKFAKILRYKIDLYKTIVFCKNVAKILQKFCNFAKIFLQFYNNFANLQKFGQRFLQKWIFTIDFHLIFAKINTQFLQHFCNIFSNFAKILGYFCNIFATFLNILQ